MLACLTCDRLCTHDVAWVTLILGVFVLACVVARVRRGVKAEYAKEG